MAEDLCHRRQSVSTPDVTTDEGHDEEDERRLTHHNSQGVVTDDTYQTDKNPCQTDNKKDLSVQVTMDGSWGAAAGVNSADMRGAMVSTLWSSLITLWKQNEYVVYEGCYGTVWQNSPAYSATAACGPKSATSCATACSKVGTPKLTQCDTATFGSKVPSKIRVTAYEGDKLLAEELTVTFGATDNDISDGGCGLVGVVAKQLAGFVPGVGSLFAAGIDFKCAKA